MAKRKRSKSPDRSRKKATDTENRRITRSQTREAREAAERQRQEHLQKELRARIEADREAREAKVEDSLIIGDGKFHMTFIKMGHGDCAMFRTPEGTVGMIDCGSHARDRNIVGNDHEETQWQFERRVERTVKLHKYLRWRDALDCLILTHPDEDHYNYLERILEGKRIRNLYHSGNIDQYSSRNTSAYLRHTASLRHAVTINNQEQRVLTYGMVQEGTQETAVEHVVTDYRWNIIDEENCRVWILCGNVRITPTGLSDNNTGSLVTLFEVFGKTILVCGDATDHTEAFLLDRHENAIKNLNYLQVPHHGSDTSSSRRFVRTTDPKHVVVSAGRNVRLHHLPKQRIVYRYRRQRNGGMNDNMRAAESHYVGTWQFLSFEEERLEEAIYITGNQSYDFSISRLLGGQQG